MLCCCGSRFTLLHREDWVVTSNVESGDGYSDILIEAEEDSIGVVIEVKYAENENFEKACQEAMDQIDRMGYGDSLLDNGMKQIFKYGIACYKKKCKLLGTKPVSVPRKSAGFPGLG